MMSSVAVFVTLLGLFGAYVSCSKPEQVHLNWNGNPSEMLLTWVMDHHQDNCMVHYGSSGQKVGSRYEHVMHGSRRHSYTYRAKMTGLKIDTEYKYYIQCPSSRSDNFQFKTFPDQSTYLPKIVVYGDFGLYNAVSKNSLLQENAKKSFDVVWHIGDFAYDMNNDEGTRGDKFMRMIEPIAARVPYSVIPGNHEDANGFHEYKHKFSTGGNPFYHSYNIGNIHFVAINTEFYWTGSWGAAQIQAQYDWLKADLAHANRPENRQKQPWIIVMGHRPIVCTSWSNRDCGSNNIVRTGYNHYKCPLEPVLYNYGVDLYLTGHMHTYERLWPTYKYRYTDRNQKLDHYHDAKYPVHIVTGAPGVSHGHGSGFQTDSHKPAWSAVQVYSSWGYTRLNALSPLHLEIKQWSTDHNRWDDHFQLTKSKARANFPH